MTEYTRRIYTFTYILYVKLPMFFTMHFLTPIKAKDKDLENLAKQDNEKPVIMAEEVKSWFPKSFFEITISEAEDLAKFLNAMRITKPKNYVSLHSAMQNIVNACRQLSDNLPEGIQFIQNKIEYLPPPTHPNKIKEMEGTKQFLEHLQKIQEEINQLRNEGELIIRKKLCLCYWHLDAAFIARKIWSWGARRKKHISFKQANSPLIKIVKRALERANVVSVSEAAIVQALNRFPTEEEYQQLTKYAPDN